MRLRTEHTSKILTWLRMCRNQQAYRAYEEFKAWCEEEHDVTRYDNWLIGQLLECFRRYC